MSSLRVLITNLTLAGHTGTELYVRDLSLELLRRGHRPICYTPKPGWIAEQLAAATVPVVDRLDQIATTPDIIHGHHSHILMSALLRFPSVPAIFFCHDWNAWHDQPPRFPTIRRYVPVDMTCRDRLLCQAAIPEERISVINNFVDLERFQPRPPLPDRPRRGLVFSNHAKSGQQLRTIAAACRERNIRLDVLGINSGTACQQPEEQLREYDLVFAKGKSAMEAIAVGAAVILSGKQSLGPMVTTQNLDQLLPLNFGRRALQNQVDLDSVSRQLANYDANDAAAVSEKVRETIPLVSTVDKLIDLYETVIDEFAEQHVPDRGSELASASEYIESMQGMLEQGARRTRNIERMRFIRKFLRWSRARLQPQSRLAS